MVVGEIEERSGVYCWDSRRRTSAPLSVRVALVVRGHGQHVYPFLWERENTIDFGDCVFFEHRSHRVFHSRTKRGKMRHMASF